MIDRPKFERTPDPEEDKKFLTELENQINALNTELGHNIIKLVGKNEEEDIANGHKRQSLEEIKAAGKNDVYDPVEMANEEEEARERELEQVRTSDVLKIMAEDAAAKELEKVAEEKETASAKEITRRTSAFDPEMQEILLQEEQEEQQGQEQQAPAKEQTVAQAKTSFKKQPPVSPKRREIDVIGQGTEPIDKELAENVEKFMAIQKELKSLDQEIADIKTEFGELEDLEEQPENTPLVAVGVDWMKSEDKLAKKLAREDLKAEMEESGLIKRIWKGRLFREYYEEKYMDEYLKGHRKSKDGRDLYEIIDNQKQELMNDIVFDVTDDIRNANQEDWNKRLVPVDKETNEKIKSTIEDYARFMYDLAEIRPDMAKNRKLLNEVDDRFDRYMIHILEQAEEEGRIDGYIETNNYLNVAKEAARRYKEAMRNAKDKVEQDAAMAKVMIGFRAYNYESIKTFSEEHKNNVDKIINSIGSDKIGQVVPAEVFSEAVDALTRDPAETKIINNIKKAKDSIGGEEGVRIMLDKNPITTDYMTRCQKWWNNLSSGDKKRVEALVAEIDSYPSRYNIEWGNGFRTWFNIRDKLVA